MNMTTRLAARAALAASIALCAPALADDAPKAVPAIPLMKPVAQDAAKQPAPADTIDPKAKAIHDKGVDAVKKLKAIELTSELKVDGVDMGMVPPELLDKTRVVLDFKTDGSSPMPFGRFTMESMKDGKVTARFAFDGKSALLVDETAKRYREGGQEWFMLLGQRAANLPQWYLENRMDLAAMGADAPTLVGATMVGEENLDGTACDVVRCVRTMKLDVMEDEDGKPAAPREMRMTETIAFARTDGLPRRVMSKTEVPGEEAMAAMSTTVTFSGVKADPAADDKTFATAAPAGYTKAEPPAAPAEDEQPQMKVKAGDAAPDFKLMDTAGKEVTLASLKGKVVLLDFWATWCGPCKAAMPSIQKISEDYKGKDVVVLGVNTWERKEGAGKKYMDDKGYTYGCLLKGDDLAKEYGISGIPTLVVIGKDGKLALIEVGFGPNGDKGLRGAIDAALAK